MLSGVFPVSRHSNPPSARELDGVRVVAVDVHRHEGDDLAEAAADGGQVAEDAEVDGGEGDAPPIPLADGAAPSPVKLSRSPGLSGFQRMEMAAQRLSRMVRKLLTPSLMPLRRFPPMTTRREPMERKSNWQRCHDGDGDGTATATDENQRQRSPRCKPPGGDDVSDAVWTPRWRSRPSWIGAC